jgi:hypothetical protein
MADVPFPGGWRYSLGALAGWLLFLVLVVAAIWGRAQGWPVPALVVLAVGPAIITGLQFHIAWRLVDRQDEYVRGLFARRMLVAGAASIVIAVGWSGLEAVGAPHLPAWLLYPLIWGLFGVVAPLMSRTAP